MRARKWCGAEPDVEIGPQEQPGISLAKTPDAQTVRNGSDVTFTITVTNTGEVGLSTVQVIDPLAPQCDRTFAGLAARASVSYACTIADVMTGLTNRATVTGTVSESATAYVDVINPYVTFEKWAAPGMVHEGEMVRYTITKERKKLFSWNWGVQVYQSIGPGLPPVQVSAHAI
jgi:uncharacterized repeat protein (TIGR01451 family)